MGGWNRNRSGDVDRLRLGILALAWLFTRALRRCVRWKLLSRFRARSFRASLSPRLAVIAGWNGDGFLLFLTGGSDFSAGGDKNFSAISVTGDRCHIVVYQAACVSTSVQP